MKGKIAFVVGASIGYILGARAGRKRYEQIKSGAEKLWNTPPIQAGAGQVKDFLNARGAAAQSLAGDVFKAGFSLFVDRLSANEDQAEAAPDVAPVEDAAEAAPEAAPDKTAPDKAAPRTGSKTAASSAKVGKK